MHIAYRFRQTCCTLHRHVGSNRNQKRGVCLALLVHAGIIFLRSLALLSSRRSGHRVFVGTITGLLPHNTLNQTLLPKSSQTHPV